MPGLGFVISDLLVTCTPHGGARFRTQLNVRRRSLAPTAPGLHAPYRYRTEVWLHFGHGGRAGGDLWRLAARPTEGCSASGRYHAASIVKQAQPACWTARARAANPRLSGCRSTRCSLLRSSWPRSSSPALSASLRIRGALLAFDALKVPGPLAQGWMRTAHPWAEVLIALCLTVTSGMAAVVTATITTALAVTYLVLIVRALQSRSRPTARASASSGPSRSRAGR